MSAHADVRERPEAATRPRAAAARRIASMRALLPLAAFVLLLGIWEVLVLAGVFNRLVLPPPTEVVSELVSLLSQGYFWDAVGVTVWEAFAGFWIGATAGFVLGTLIGLNDLARRSLYPIAVALQSTPQVAIAPLFLVWFGFGLTPRVLFAATTCLFPVLVAVVVGLETADRDSRMLLHSLGASRWQTYRKLLLPASLPTMFAGIRTAVPLALVGAIVGEFVGGNEGLGVLITTFNAQLQIAASFAIVTVLAIIGVTAYRVVDLVDRRVVDWQQRRDR